jgi:hypothetical protein
MIWCGYAKTGKNPLFPFALWGFLESSEEKKPQITNLEKII